MCAQAMARAMRRDRVVSSSISRPCIGPGARRGAASKRARAQSLPSGSRKAASWNRLRAFGKWHQIIVDEGGDAEAQKAAMLASGEAKEGDQFIVITIVSPPAWEPAR